MNKERKSLWHSELVKMSPVTALIMSEPTESKFPDRPRWVALEINGEERFLSCENTSIELALAGMKGQWARLNAVGRGEEALIEIEDAPDRAAKAAPTGFAKAKAQMVSDPEATTRRAEAPGDKIKSYAAHSMRVFNIAWEESKNWLSTIPEKDALELSVRDWYDLRLRVAQGITIEVNKIIRKERF